MAADPSPKGRGTLSQKPLSRDELLELARQEALSMVGKPLEEVFEMLDRGELEGTLAGAHSSPSCSIWQGPSGARCSSQGFLRDHPGESTARQPRELAAGTFHRLQELVGSRVRL